MTRVEFIVNVKNKLNKAAELCEQAVAKGHQFTISSPDETLYQTLQQALWHASPSSFLPMLFLEKSDHAQRLTHHCAIHFLHNMGKVEPDLLQQDDVMLHFHDTPPPFFSRFRHLIELVGVDEPDKIAARARYKFYRDRGYDIKTTHMSDN